jgi:hypothetical protein
MQRRTRRLVGAVALIAALAAGGAAFTTSNSLPATDTAGYGNISVSGATVSDIKNTLVSGGQYISAVELDLASPTAANAVVQAGFGSSSTPATTGNLITCTTTTPGTTTTYTCDFSGLTNGGFPTSSADNFSVVVSH